MKSKWKEVPLSQLYEFSSGLSKPRSEFGFGYDFLSFKDVFYNIFLPDKLSELVNSTEKERESCSIKRGDVFLTRTSETMEDLGMSCVALRDYESATFNGFTKRLRPKNNVKMLPEYAGFFFRSPKFRLQVTAMSSLSTRASLNNEMLGRLKMVLPSLEEQAVIGFTLKGFDDRLKLNRRMNDTLEAIVSAIFKSWFADFDPVRTKADGRQPLGMTAETAALFPDSFEDSDIGRVPSGWKVERFSDHFSVAKGLSYKGAFLSEKGVGMPMHNLDSIYEGGGYKHGGLKWYTGEHKERHLVQPGDVVITNTEQGFEYLLIGYPAIIPYHYGETGLFSHHLYLLKPSRDTAVQPVFMYFLLRTRRYHDVVAGFTNGTTVNMLPADGLGKPKFAVPPKAILDIFYKIVGPIQKRMDKVHEESLTLQDVRDTLLPKLISGEIRVKDAEKFVEEHAG
jgi:type I restriction enzyme S subunit